MTSINPRIEESWKEVLQNEFSAPYFKDLSDFLREEKSKYVVYPPGPRIFAAFDHTPFNRVKVVILGQDPYHGPGQAHGLCFSVPDGIAHPPSLQNIFKEIESDLGIPVSKKSDLSHWADQGVLLINAILTVRANEPASHQNKGWETFTDAVIRNLSERRKNLVFLLWGNYAQAKEKLIDSNRHFILKAAHPSPLSAYRGFFGCKHFSRTNEILAEQGLNGIDWQLKKELVFVTNNPHKLREIKAITGDRYSLLSLSDIGCNEEIVEDADTIPGNASLKSWFIFNKYGRDCFADDTGLEIDALNGNPGVKSARYAGDDCNPENNIRKVLSELEGSADRKARFRTVISLIINGNETQFEGIVEGTILKEKRGQDGFGYDPIFLPDGYNESFAEMEPEKKNLISHRGRATKKLIEFLMHST